MTDIFVVGYDGSKGADRAVAFAVARAKAGGAELRILHILEWSAYSFLTPEELGERHMRRQQELERASKDIDPVVERVQDQGVKASAVIRYGHAAELLCEFAEEVGAAQIFIGRTGHSKLEARLFGSVPGALMQSAPVPVTVVP
jgi:nucleotide-binding universal stress UspA family protein